jgi:hypothetical protein
VLILVRRGRIVLPALQGDQAYGVRVPILHTVHVEETANFGWWGPGRIGAWRGAGSELGRSDERMRKELSHPGRTKIEIHCRIGHAPPGASPLTPTPPGAATRGALLHSLRSLRRATDN